MEALEGRTIVHIAKGSDGDVYALCFVLDRVLGERIKSCGGGHDDGKTRLKDDLEEGNMHCCLLDNEER